MKRSTENAPPVAGVARIKTRRQYATPKLTDFGKVRELTAGGSSGMSENQPFQGQKQRP
jgi:hypothetical protein